MPLSPWAMLISLWSAMTILLYSMSALSALVPHPNCVAVSGAANIGLDRGLQTCVEATVGVRCKQDCPGVSAIEYVILHIIHCMSNIPIFSVEAGYIQT